MYEAFLVLWLAIVAIFVYFVAKRQRLIFSSPTERIAEDRTLMDQASALIAGAVCPLCRGLVNVEQVEYESFTARTRCRICKQPAFWRYHKNRWMLIAPFKYTPNPVIRVEPTQSVPDLTVASTNAESSPSCNQNKTVQAQECPVKEVALKVNLNSKSRKEKLNKNAKTIHTQI